MIYCEKADQFKHLVQSLPAILIIVFMAACSSGDDGSEQTAVKKSSSASAGTGTEDQLLQSVPFITLRNKTGSDKASKFFGDERSVEQAGYCDVSRTPIKPLKSIAEKASIYVPEDIAKLKAIRESSIDDLWHGLEMTSNGKHPILYLHGYYVSFDRGCRRASLFQESLGLAGRYVLFSWPSDGAILNYTRDESDLYWSVAPLVETLDDMINRFGAGNFDIAAHSLGTRGVFLALVMLAQAAQGNEPLVDQVVLIAPDIDVGIFKQHLPQILPLVRNITIYVSSNDRPLTLSRQVHGYPRLGESGAHLEGLTGIEIVDLSNISVRYPSGHVYHLYHDIVVNDLDQLLNGGKRPSQRSNLKQTGDDYWQLHPEVIDN